MSSFRLVLVAAGWAGAGRAPGSLTLTLFSPEKSSPETASDLVKHRLHPLSTEPGDGAELVRRTDLEQGGVEASRGR